MKIIINLVILAVIGFAGWYVYENVQTPDDMTNLLDKKTIDEIKDFAIEKTKSVETDSLKDYAIEKLKEIDTEELKQLLVDNKEDVIDYIKQNKDDISIDDFDSIKSQLSEVLSDEQIQKLREEIK